MTGYLINTKMAFELQKLPYAYNAIEPYIDAQNGFITNVNSGVQYSNKWNDKNNLNFAPPSQEMTITLNP